jgi:hypothetical protein
MAQSKAPTVDAYLDELPPDRRAVVAAVRDTIRRNLPDGYREAMAFGMIGWGIPLERYPDTYNKQPLGCVALAAQKHYYALYLPCAYMDPAAEARLRGAFAAAGKKLDMGKSCVRFKRLEDLPLAAIGAFVAETPPEALIATYEAARARA